MGNLHVRRAAVRDLDEIWLHIARDSPGNAQKQIDEIESAFKQVAQFPGLGRSRDELKQGLYSFPVGNYIVFFKAVRNGVTILHVLHGAREHRKFFE